MDLMPRTPASAKQVFSLFSLEAEALLSKINLSIFVIIDLFQEFNLNNFYLTPSICQALCKMLCVRKYTKQG